MEYNAVYVEAWFIRDVVSTGAVYIVEVSFKTGSRAEVGQKKVSW